MTLDCDIYRINVKLIKQLADAQPAEERLQSRYIGLLALTTGVPIIIVACYLGELYGFTEELNAFIERLKAFYKIKQVNNIKSV